MDGQASWMAAQQNVASCDRLVRCWGHGDMLPISNGRMHAGARGAKANVQAVGEQIPSQFTESF
jgi:hypothetical protein